MPTPFAGLSLGQQGLQSARYTSQLPVTVSFACLKMYCYDYGNSSDDGHPDEVPNSGSDNDAPHKAGLVSEEDCSPKRLRISSL
jgi:hypothetical protein